MDVETVREAIARAEALTEDWAGTYGGKTYRAGARDALAYIRGYLALELEGADTDA